MYHFNCLLCEPGSKWNPPRPRYGSSGFTEIQEHVMKEHGISKEDFSVRAAVALSPGFYEHRLLNGMALYSESLQCKQFTDADVNDGEFPKIYCDRSDLLYDPPEWMKRGLQETASGYGRRLNSGLKINFNGKLYRIYTTIFSNAGSSWFITKGRKIYVD